MTKETIKRYALSTFITFMSGFLTYLLAALENIEFATDLTYAVFSGAFLAGVRLAMKGLVETQFGAHSDLTKKQ